MEIIKENEANIGKIITALKEGAVLVLPTDTVYGLVCDATNDNSISKIYKIKKRDKSKPLAVFVKDIKEAKKYAVIKPEQEQFLKNNWPGSTTVILEKKSGLSSSVYKDNTIAMRQPNYRLIAEIMDLFKSPLAQTSANISNQPATTKIKNIVNDFKDEDVLIIDAGDLPKNNPSTIIDLSNSNIKIIRR